MSKFSLLFIFIFLYGLYAAIATGTVWGFYLYQLVYFLNPGDRWWSSSLPTISYSFIIVLVLLVSFSYKKSSFNINLIKTTPPFKWFLMLIIVYCMVSFVAVSSEYHERFLIDLIKLYLIMFIAFRILDSQEKITYALYAYLVGAAYIGFEAYSVGRNEFGRVEGIGTVDAPESNGIAAALAPAIPIIIYFLWRKELKIKLIIGFLGIFIVNGLILINSRGAFLAGLIGFTYIIMIAIFSNYKLPKQKMMVVVLILGSIIGGLSLTDAAFWERMNTIQDQSSKEDVDASGGRRINFWLASLDMVEDHPFGLGIYGFQTLSPLYLDASLMGADFRKKTTRAVHSLWFQAFSEVGYIGIVIFLLLLRSIYKYSKRAKLKAIELKDIELYYFIILTEASLLTFLVAGSFINACRAEIFYWMMIFNVSIASVTLNRTLPQNKSALDQKVE